MRESPQTARASRRISLQPLSEQFGGYLGSRFGGIMLLCQTLSTLPTPRTFIGWLGVAFIGHRLLQSSRHKSQTMRNANQLAHEEHLKQARLGPPKAAHPQHTNIMNVTARDVHAPIIGASSKANITIGPTYNNLPAIKALINDIYARREELVLAPSQRVQFEAQFNAIQEQLRAQAPNHSRLHESLLSIRHIAEAGAAHMLVGHWGDILHALQRITGP
jgi:hypothetical protein